MTPAFKTFVAPARQRNQLWRLALGVFVIGLCWVGGTFIVLFGGQILLGGNGLLAASAEVQDGSTPFGMAILFLTFLGLLAGPMLAAKLLHKRGPASLTGPIGAMLGDFLRVMPTIIVFYVAVLVLWLLVYDPTPNLLFSQWLVILPIGLAGLLVQTLAEELAFRGYLMQQLAARFRSPIIWMGLPSLAFGMLHYTGQYGGQIGILVVLATGVFGLAAADLTRRTGNIGAAWALHLSNNAVAILFLATEGNLAGMSLWLTPYAMNDTATMSRMIVVDIMTLCAVWYVVARKLRD